MWSKDGMMEFYKKLIGAAAFWPMRIESPNAWVGHIPFVAWLIGETHPSILVELGTHSGNSYLSMCQAVKEHNLATRCYAVDTWRGDDHASHYGEEVCRDLAGYHQATYASFSNLLRMTFDDALQYFEDGTIDLLHIDGLHTYEAVKHDFETWLPKMAPGGIVMLHDTNVRERNFGVWKLWGELSCVYPLRLEFDHSHGLGVIQTTPIGQNPQPQFWLEDRKLGFLVKNYFANLGRGVQERFYSEQQKEKAIILQCELKNNNDKMQKLEHHISEQKNSDKTSQAVYLNKQIDSQNKEIASLRNVDERCTQLQAQNKLLEAELYNEKKYRDALLSSNSWRMTAPFRLIGQYLRSSLDKK